MAGLKNSIQNVADRIGKAGKKASNVIAQHTPTAVKKGGLGAAVGAALGAMGAVAEVAVEGVALNALGFTTLGPAANSYAAMWMSTITITNGVGVPMGSTYATLQAAGMGSGALVGAPVVIGVCAAAGVVAMAVLHYNNRDGDGDGDAAGAVAMAVLHYNKRDGDGDGDAAGGNVCPSDSTKADEDEALSVENDVTAQEQPWCASFA